MRDRFGAIVAALCVLADPNATWAQSPARLAGTSWQLVRFQGGDGSVLTPDDRTTYTIAFYAQGSTLR